MSLASTSVEKKVPTTVPADTFSATLDAERAISDGASLTLVTVIVNCFSVLSPPASVERTRTE